MRYCTPCGTKRGWPLTEERFVGECPVCGNLCNGNVSPSIPEPDAVLRRVRYSLIEENGAGFGFVCIWRPGDTGDSARHGVTVGEWLTRPENRSGEWLIDGGWGGPPGPIKVVWRNGEWHVLGFPPWREASDQE